MQSMLRKSVAARRTMLVAGPSSLVLVHGVASIAGAPLVSGARIVVREEKQLPVEVAQDSVFEISLGHGASVGEIEGSSIPESWMAAAEALSDLDEGVAVILGPTDVGKSTLCTYLANSLFRRGMRVSVIDADIGQTDMGPPTTVCRGDITEFAYALGMVRQPSRIFVGHNSPGRVSTKVISSVGRLMSIGTQSSQLLVNTDGWVAEPEAIEYKLRLLDAIQPDLILAIALENELDPVLDRTRFESMLLRLPEVVRIRSRSDRKTLREASYRTYLSGGRVHSFDLNKISLKGPYEYEDDERFRNWGWLRANVSGLLAGFEREDGLLMNIGVVLGVEASRKLCRVFAGIDGLPTAIQLGSIRLAVDGSELGYLDLA